MKLRKIHSRKQFFLLYGVGVTLGLLLLFLFTLLIPELVPLWGFSVGGYIIGSILGISIMVLLNWPPFPQNGDEKPS